MTSTVVCVDLFHKQLLHPSPFSSHLLLFQLGIYVSLLGGWAGLLVLLWKIRSWPMRIQALGLAEPLALTPGGADIMQESVVLLWRNHFRNLWIALAINTLTIGYREQSVWFFANVPWVIWRELSIMLVAGFALYLAGVGLFIASLAPWRTVIRSAFYALLAVLAGILGSLAWREWVEEEWPRHLGVHVYFSVPALLLVGAGRLWLSGVKRLDWAPLGALLLHRLCPTGIESRKWELNALIPTTIAGNPCSRALSLRDSTLWLVLKIVLGFVLAGNMLIVYGPLVFRGARQVVFHAWTGMGILGCVWVLFRCLSWSAALRHHARGLFLFGKPGEWGVAPIKTAQWLSESLDRRWMQEMAVWGPWLLMILLIGAPFSTWLTQSEVEHLTVWFHPEEWLLRLTEFARHSPSVMGAFAMGILWFVVLRRWPSLWTLSIGIAGVWVVVLYSFPRIMEHVVHHREAPSLIFLLRLGSLVSYALLAALTLRACMGLSGLGRFVLLGWLLAIPWGFTWSGYAGLSLALAAAGTSLAFCCAHALRTEQQRFVAQLCCRSKMPSRGTKGP